MSRILINCDMGEGMDNEREIMPFIDAANIACGYHAGNEETMRETIALCVEYDVVIGAHPSYHDRGNFGRKEMHLPVPVVYDLVKEQLKILDGIASSAGRKIRHVKPHGALYNLSAKNKEIAFAIASAVRDHNDTLLLMGLSGSHSVEAAAELGLKVANEVFADRTYRDDGSLTSRKEANALVSDTAQLKRQVMEMAFEQKVTTVTGKKISIRADTICIHGDGPHAVEFAREVFHLLRSRD